MNVSQLLSVNVWVREIKTITLLQYFVKFRVWGAVGSSGKG